MKIVYCASQLHRPGGTEKVLTEKVNFLLENTDFEVWIITEDQNGRPLCFDLNEKVKLHDVNISMISKKVIPGITFISNIFKLRKIYSKLFLEIQPDVVIVVERGYLDFVIPFINKSITKVREFHFAKNAVKAHTKLMEGFFKQFRHKLRYKLLFSLFNKYDYLVLLTQRDQKEGNYKTKTKVIYNMIQSLPEKTASLEVKNVITVGSMYDKRKNFAEQILLWKNIITTHPDWVLNVYGDGKERVNLQKLIDDNKLHKNVILHGNSYTMNENYNNSSIFLFTSQAEGFPMVLIEALSHGLPCIAYDAPTGPSDIIQDGYNGYLVKNNDRNDLETKLKVLMDDVEKRKHFGLNARECSKLYTPKNVMTNWIEFFNSIKK